MIDEKIEKKILARVPEEERNIAPIDVPSAFENVRTRYFKMPKEAEANVRAKTAEDIAEQQFVGTFGVKKDQLISMDKLFRESIRVKGDELKGMGFAGKWALAYASARADIGTLQPECRKCVNDMNDKLWEYYHKADIEVGRVATAQEMEERMRTLDRKLQELKKVV